MFHPYGSVDEAHTLSYMSDFHQWWVSGGLSFNLAIYHLELVFNDKLKLIFHRQDSASASQK